MGRVIPFRNRRGGGPPEHEGRGADKWRILRLVPLPQTLWHLYIAAVDTFTGPEPRILTWTDTVAAWGEVEWTWSEPHPLFPPVEIYWEALVCDAEGTLWPVGTQHASNVVDTVVVGPGEELPEWWGGLGPADDARRALLAKYRER